eukprot:8989522-Pyramimonas_sp.AAC.1
MRSDVYGGCLPEALPSPIPSRRWPVDPSSCKSARCVARVCTVFVRFFAPVCLRPWCPSSLEPAE